MMNRNDSGERTNKHGEDKRACCSSPASIGYEFAVSLLAWAILSLIGLYWRPFRAASATNILLAAVSAALPMGFATGRCVAESPVPYSC
jgi:hypothetical protein